MTLLSKIELHLRATQIPPTRFGREAASDPRFVLDLRQGREVGHKLAARVNAYLSGTGQ